ncbi:MAG: hypothetical protein HY300_08070 [Verrucomicrobia bacterium]|nr:hypothetical protein [Verrucomicrobiota bacterium]
MSTVAEISDALPKLSDTELRQVERALIGIYRQRRAGIIFDDAYGVWTEEDQMAVADQAFQLLDAAEKEQEKVRKP